MGNDKNTKHTTFSLRKTTSLDNLRNNAEPLKPAPKILIAGINKEKEENKSNE